MKRLTLTHWIFIAIALAIVIGLILPATPAGAEPGLLSKDTLMAVAKPIGDLFLRLLKMIVVPLIFASIVTGVLGVGGSKSLGRLGAKTVVYYLTTSTIAILIGLSFVNVVGPGRGLHLDQNPDVVADIGRRAPEQMPGGGESGGLWGFLLRMIPDNPVEAMASADMLGIIFFALLFGGFITTLPEPKRRLMTDLFESFFDVMMRMTRFVILAAPVGIFGLVTYQVAENSADPGRFRDLGVAVIQFFFVVVAALATHAFIVLPLLLFLLGRIRNPYRHMRAMAKALLTAFSTASSSATLPLTMECVEDNSGVSNRTTSFVLPLGATVNMDGTALYECVVVIFIAQAFSFGLSIAAQVTIVVTALLTSIGVAGVPMASLVAIVIVLKTAGMEAYLPGIGLIMVTDRILDMMRTTVNVWSDSCGAVIIARTEGERTKLVD